MPAARSSAKNMSRLVELPIDEAARRLAFDAGLPEGYPLVLVHKRTNRRLTRQVSVDLARMPRLRAANDVRLSEVAAAFHKWVARANELTQHKAEVWHRVVPGEKQVRRPVAQNTLLLKLQDAGWRADTHRLGLVRAATLRSLRRLAKTDPDVSMDEVIGGTLSALVEVVGSSASVKRAAARI